MIALTRRFRISGWLAWLGAAILTARTAPAQPIRPDGPTLRELAEARGFHIGANFPTLYQCWREEGEFGPRRFDPEAAIAKDHFTIVTPGWESFPGHTWKGEGVYDFEGTRLDRRDVSIRVDLPCRDFEVTRYGISLDVCSRKILGGICVRIPVDRGELHHGNARRCVGQ